MAQLQALYAWILANKPMFVAILYAVSQFATTLQMHIPASEMPAWLSTIFKWAGYIAPAGTKGFIGRFSPPFVHIPRAAGAPAAMPPAALFLPFVCVLFASCSYCQQAANKNTAECKAYRSLAQCGPQVLAIVAADLGDISAGDWPKVLADILQQVPAEYECFVMATQAQLVAKYGPNSPEVIRFSTAAGVARAKAKAAHAQ